MRKHLGIYLREHFRFGGDGLSHQLLDQEVGLGVVTVLVLELFSYLFHQLTLTVHL